MIGSGVETSLTNVAEIVLPHASVISAGAPGSVASAGHSTVSAPLAGSVHGVVLVTV